MLNSLLQQFYGHYKLFHLWVPQECETNGQDMMMKGKCRYGQVCSSLFDPNLHIAQ